MAGHHKINYPTSRSMRCISSRGLFRRSPSSVTAKERRDGVRGNSRRSRLFSCTRACQKRLVHQVEITVLLVVHRAWTEQHVVALPSALKRHHSGLSRAKSAIKCHLKWTGKAAEQRIGLGQAATRALNRELPKRPGPESTYLHELPHHRRQGMHSGAQKH